jgi:hypothetical protein
VANRDTLAIMIKQGLEILLEHVATWPEEAQEELVQSMVDIEKKHLGIYHLNDEERAAELDCINLYRHVKVVILQNEQLNCSQLQ